LLPHKEKNLIKKRVAQKQQKASTQDTSIQSRTVTVTSAFQPVLKPTSKINFSAATPQADTSTPNLSYNVPAQNLSFTYRSPQLKALAENIDTTVHWDNTSFIKAGFGNYTTPYVQAGLSFGDGSNSIVNLNGKYTSSKSNIPFQQFNKTEIEGIGIFTKPTDNNEWNARVFFYNNRQYQYGFSPDTLKYNKEDLRNSFSAIGGRIALKNKAANALGIDYNPSLALTLFTDNHNATEQNFVVNAPVSKSFGKMYAFTAGFTADLTNFDSDSASINNNLYYLSAQVQFKTPNFTLHAGILPSWDNTIFHLLPNITAEAKIKR